MGIEELQKILSSTIKRLVELLINYDKNSLSFSPLTHIKYKHRESLYYRMNSIIFHLQLLIFVKNQGINILNKNIGNNNPVLLRNVIDELYYVFDDLIFNILSLIDYLGNFIGYVYINKQNRKITWNRVVKTCRDQSNELSNKELNKYIISVDKRLVNHLYEYRSILIHYNKDGSNAEHSTHFDSKGINHTLNVEAPNLFVKTLKNIKIDIKSDILDVAFNSAYESLVIAQKIVDLIAEDVIPKNEENMEKLYEEYKKRKDE